MSTAAPIETSVSSFGAVAPSRAGTSAATNYPAEARFAVVMYGGVSLAIYINGVAQELLHMVKATTRDTSRRPMIAEKQLTKTERVYRKVSYLLGGADPDGAKELLESNAEIPTRFIIDIISGTSAGGINGIFLAKALANGQSLDSLQELWIKEGDLALLINDQGSVEKPLALNKPPASLLNSRRMYLKLLEAFDGMEATAGPTGAAADSAYVDELDLYVTTTDIQGIPLPIRLADEIVYERRHRNVLHFVYSKAGVSGEKADRNDLQAHYNPFLAYASRCTSAYPFAFEPMCLCDTDDVLGRMGKYAGNGNCKSDSALWQRFYKDYLNPKGVASVAFPRRSFGDGGYLDNKPFTYATETLTRRHADVPVDRKLIYVEPSPEHPEDIPDTHRRPNVLENSMAALMSLPRYETIREDLARVIQRNRMIGRINGIIRGFERDIDEVERQAQQGANCGAFWLPRDTGELWAKADLTDEEWTQLDLADMMKRKGRGYLGYHRLVIARVTDDLAKLVARVAGFDEESDYFHVTRSLVRAWRDRNYVEYRQSPNDKTMNGFLLSFDLTYSIRRLNLLRSRIDRFYQLDEEARAVMNLRVKGFWPGDAAVDARKEHEVRAELRSIKSKLNDVYVSLRSTGRTLRSRQDPHQATEKATPASPVHAKIQDLIAEIGEALAKTRPQAAQSIAQDNPMEPGSLILDYFLGAQGKLATPSSGEIGGPRDAGRIQAECDKRARKFLDANEKVATAFTDLGVLIEQQIRPAVKDADKACKGMLLLPNTSPDLPPGAIDARSCLAHYYRRYEEYDMIIFPILYDTNLGEAVEVEIIRVSPEDGRALIDERKSGCHKLAGTYLANFGGFLERLWRKNDIFWGRLDGAERIIRALLGNDPRADALIGEAQAAIVCETIEHIGDKEMKDLLAESLMRPKSGKPDADTLGRFIANLKDHTGDPQLRKTLGDRIKEGEIRDHYQEVFETHSSLQPTEALRTVARATTVIGNMLSDIAAQRNLKTKYIGWIAKLGEIFWGFVEVAVPRSMANLVFLYWLKLVYLFEAVVLVGGMLLANKEVQQFALTAFAITLSTHLAVRVLQDYLQYRYTWLNGVKGAAIIIFLTLIIFGGLSITAVTGMAEPVWHALVWMRTRFAPAPV